MYKLLIVDDEKVVIEGLLSAVDWHEHQIEVVGTAMDGNNAYRLIEENEPNIVMADIRMPGLNGLDLIQKVKDVYPDTAFIIISGYTQFDYAKRAIELEAVDYLTKPIELDEIIAAVKRAIQKYEKLKERKEANIKLKNYQSQVEEKYVLHSLFGHQIDHLGYFEEYNSCTVLVTDCTSKTYSTETLLELIKSQVNQEEKCRNFSCVIEDHLVTICFFYSSYEEEKGFLRRLKSFYKDIMDDPITGISSTHKEITTLQPLYKEAMEAYHIGLYLQQEVTHYQDLETMTNTIGSNILKRMDEFFLERKIDLSSINKLIDHLLDFSIIEKLTPTKSKFLCFKLINHVFEYVHEEFDMNVEDVLQEEKYLIYQHLNRLRTMEEHKEWLLEIIGKLFNYLFDNQMSQKEKLMYDVKKYLKETYNQTIGLDVIAQKFHISPAYLSSIFSKKTGVTLFEYIINMRMEKAKELLRTTNNKISDICQQVGYENQRYFNQVFKKHIGTTPGSYRSNHLVK
ncbi:response regulator [Bacillus salipaludis]|uniref:response regulator transcription factor n=1 Tax=Bacillus salipaludis TaxID=2547811 RepID=UPI003D1D9D6C